MPQTIVKYAIIALFTAIGLTFMGLADQIVMMAFGLILGSAAVATAIAFGLGGRDCGGADARATGQRTRSPRRRAPTPPPPRLQERQPKAEDEQPAAAGVSALRFDVLRRDRLVGREGPAAQGHRDCRGAAATRRRG